MPATRLLPTRRTSARLSSRLSSSLLLYSCSGCLPYCTSTLRHGHTSRQRGVCLLSAPLFTCSLASTVNTVDFHRSGFPGYLTLIHRTRFPFPRICLARPSQHQRHIHPVRGIVASRIPSYPSIDRQSHRIYIALFHDIVPFRAAPRYVPCRILIQRASCTQDNLPHVDHRIDHEEDEQVTHSRYGQFSFSAPTSITALPAWEIRAAYTSASQYRDALLH